MASLKEAIFISGHSISLAVHHVLLKIINPLNGSDNDTIYLELQ